MRSTNYIFEMVEHSGRGRKLVGPRKFSSRPRRRKAPRRKLRAGRKSAYKPSAKKAFKRMSNPIAENKQLLGSEISATVGVDVDGKVVLTDYSQPPIDQYGTPTGAYGHSMNSMHWHFNPDSMLYQTQGWDESQMIGRSVYQTLCAAKFLIKWPQPTMNTGIEAGSPGTYHWGAIPDQPMNYKLYWGWVPKKLLFTGQTTPNVNEVSAFDIETAINQRVTDYFNDRQDRIQFIPKKTATIKIEGSKKLFPPWDRRSGRMPTSTVVQSGTDSADKPFENTVHVGEIPDTLVKVKWNINRKIHFEPSNKFGHRVADPTADPPVEAENIGLANGSTVFYKNYDWLPFATIVSWNHNLLPEEGTTYERTRRCPQILVNDITYYRDS